MPLHNATASSSRDIIDSPDRVDPEDLNRAIVAVTTTVQHRSNDATSVTGGDVEEDFEEEEQDASEDCLICLGVIVDRTVLPKCLHSLFCFDCIVKWIGIHRRCPLCSASIDDYIIHSIRSDRDYIRHYLPSIPLAPNEKVEGIRIDPLRLQVDISQSEASRIRRQLQNRVGRDQSAREPRVAERSNLARPCTTTARTSEWGERRVEERQRDAIANWDQRLAFRRRIYREELYCLHIGSNKSSRLCMPPTHTTISTSKSVESMLLTFIRRELLAYPLTNDVDFLSRYTINVLKTFDCKSNEAIELIADFLGTRGAEHFCHEIYSFSRFVGEGSIQAASGRQRDKVKAFDEWAQYVKQAKQKRRSRDTGRISNFLAEMAEPEEQQVMDAAAMQDSDSPPSRSAVIQKREKLLQRLEVEKNSVAAHPIVELGKQISGLDDSVDMQSVNRERALREKLSLKRREAQLKARALQMRAKRQKI